ncbi:outer membrane porin, OprD family [Halopseudomonas xinjiangensis]|uniref:Outer membrane porin, OprD family n=1 Tax=Halopseudomonas xinjiangensis TaxID=487184 RepID=A0A1H1MJV3_9GAMM|nr:OprD family outer membrane porin [Halopseudomonas xinjiangensis]SDR86655.1 outer membrane porin, OprD family [Halopseudomonas xinjiangensis]
MKQHAERLAALVVCASVYSTSAVADPIADGSVELELRNFYINQDQRSGDPDYSRVEEWGQGVILDLESGYTPGTVGFGVDVLGQFGFRLDGGGRSDKPGSTREPGDLFPLEGGKAASEFGRIDPTAKARAWNSELRLGALQPDLPVLIRNDSRILPQTFRGAQLESTIRDDATLHAGQIHRVSQRNSADYEPMQIRGGDAGSNRFRFAGLAYKPLDDTSLTYFAAELRDYYLQHFIGLEHAIALAEGELGVDVRLFHSSGRGANAAGNSEYGARGVYAEGATIGEVDNRTASLALSYETRMHRFGLGHQWVNGDSDFPYVDNGDGASVYLITYAQVGKFQRAGERTWLAEYTYKFDDIGMPGLKFSGAYLSGRGIRSPQGGDSGEWERDLRLDFQPDDGPLRNLTLTLRHASLRSNLADQPDIDEARVVISYTLELD